MSLCLLLPLVTCVSLQGLIQFICIGQQTEGQKNRIVSCFLYLPLVLPAIYRKMHALSRDVFSRERLLQIHWMLHVQPPGTDAGAQARGRQISNIVQHTKAKCRELFRPFHNIVINENTIGFKGRSQYKMHNHKSHINAGLVCFRTLLWCHYYAMSICQNYFV